MRNNGIKRNPAKTEHDRSGQGIRAAITALFTEGPQKSLTWSAIVVFRSALFCLFVIAINKIVQSGTSTFLLCLGAIAGVVLASRLAFTRLKALGFGALLLGAFLLYQLVFRAVSLVPPHFSDRIFGSYALELHINLVFGVLVIVALSTWSFWRTSAAATIEVLFLLGLTIYALSGHRNFHFDAPRILNNLAWALGSSDLKMLVSAGALLAVFCLAFLYFSSWSEERPASTRKPQVLVHPGQRRLLAGSMLAILCVTFLSFIAQSVYRHYSVAAETRIANGVGQSRGEKMSPLGFHSALGGSAQPAGLVRLESDYALNPYSSMLYLRETALSLFNGRELVNAPRTFDRDVSNNAPDEAYELQEDPAYLNRTPLTQSVYLLAEHNSAFAVDYPLSIHQLKNPNPSRFKGAYRAYSMAPSFGLDSLKGVPVGNPAWSREEKELYLTPHSDKRYAEMAQKIIGDEKDPVLKAKAVTEHLSRNAIYTLQPGHEVAQGEDPVAPFLFGDLRGYCVHFAHAVVYLLRAVGVPARIATGYLSDLSQSKDGHILLRMSDRHAWAEVFVEGRGWLPFDVKPEQVESHAETAVDQKLLEELMGMIGPEEEILPKDAGKHEPGLQPDHAWEWPDRRWVLWPALSLLILLALGKLYLLHAWRLKAEPLARLKSAYRSLLCRLHDAGIARQSGETRQEFATRVKNTFGFESVRLAQLFSAATYAQPGRCRLILSGPGADALDQAIREDLATLTNMKWPKRYLSLLNPSSLLAACFGGRW